MSRYIDAEELAEKADRVLQSCKQANTVSLINAASEIFTLLLASAPTEDVEKVEHGRWVTLGDSEMCSVCTCTKLKEFDTAYGKAIWSRSKYCPNCGAKMDL